MVSINICCYNGEKYLRETLKSVADQTYKDWELVAINDGSSDSTEEIIREFAGRGYPVRYHSQENKGLGFSRNKAIELSRGEYIAFIDQDDIWLPEKLEKQVRLMEERKDIGLVFTDTIIFSDERVITNYFKGIVPPEGNIFKELLRANFITLSSVMARKEALLSMDELFDARFNVSEDWDLWLRMCYKAKAACVNEPLTKWRMNPESWTHRKFGLFSREIGSIIEKLTAAHPGVEGEYPSEFEKMRSAVILYKGFGLWFDNRKSEARKVLRTGLFKNLKFLLGYMATFMPLEWVPRVEKIYFSLSLNKMMW